MESPKKLLKQQLHLMAARLEEESAKISEEALIIEYDNGGGQSGTRENPFYPAYERLLKSYTSTLEAAKRLGELDEAEVKSLSDMREKLRIAT